MKPRMLAAFFPSGDPFQVYPGPDGNPEESLRFMNLHLAMQDLRALEALETLRGREHVLQLLNECAQGLLTLTEYPRGSRFLRKTPPPRERRTDNLIFILEKIPPISGQYKPCIGGFAAQTFNSSPS